jgi:hypothetical protein
MRTGAASGHQGYFHEAAFTGQGRGPADPFAGLVPARNSVGGLRLCGWSWGTRG